VKHEQEKTKEGEELDPLSSELDVQKAFSKDYAKENFHNRGRKSKQAAQARQKSCRQGDKEKRFSLIEDHSGPSKKEEVVQGTDLGCALS
jgi:hypothetical protein